MQMTSVRMVLLLAFVSLLAVVAPARSAPPKPGVPGIMVPIVTDYVLIELAGTPVDAQLDEARLEHLFDDWYRLYLQSGESVEGVQQALSMRPAVLGVHPDYIVRVPEVPDVSNSLLPPQTLLTPNDPFYNLQWHLTDIQAQSAWNVTQGTGVVVAVVDSGIAGNGPDGFCRSLHSGYNAITNSTGINQAYDDDGHGTHVAGTIAQCTGNNTGVAGLAFDARLMAVKVLDDNGSGSYSDVARGINWAANHGADVINLSLGSDCGATAWPSCSVSIVNSALSNAAAADVVIVASAGNATQPVVGFPSNHPDVMSVMATETRRLRAWYSSYGAALSLAAPGGDTSVDRNGDGYVDGVLQETVLPSWGYYLYQGTSMAAPHVSGAAALLRACVPEAGRLAVQDALEQSALDLGASGFDSTYGHGYLQVRDALETLAAQFGRDVGNNCAPITNPPDCYTLNVNIVGNGSVVQSPTPNCSGGQYADGTVVTLTADPDTGWAFDRWSGAAAGTNLSTTVNMTRNRNVTATFEEVQGAPGPGTDYEIHLSTLANGTVDGVAFRDEDVLAYSEADGWSLLFDGSDVGLGSTDVNAFTWLPDGSLLLSVDKPVSGLPGLSGTVDDSDIVRFTPTSLGTNTSGSYEMYFDGSDVGLTTTGEDIDALAVLPNGDLLISTLGALKVPGLHAADEDISRFSPSSLGSNTAGSWSLHLDVSDISGQINDVFSLHAGDDGVYGLTANRNFTASSISVRPLDIYGCTPTSFGNNTACGNGQLLFDGTAAGLPSGMTIDGLALVTP